MKKFLSAIFAIIGLSIFAVGSYFILSDGRIVDSGDMILLALTALIISQLFNKWGELDGDNRKTPPTVP
jgi:hypothetical protein